MWFGLRPQITIGVFKILCWVALVLGHKTLSPVINLFDRLYHLLPMAQSQGSAPALLLSPDLGWPDFENVLAQKHPLMSVRCPKA